MLSGLRCLLHMALHLSLSSRPQGGQSSVGSGSFMHGSVLPSHPLPLALSHCPNMEGFDIPPSFMGGAQSTPFMGGSCPFHQAHFPPSHGGRFPLGTSVLHPPPSSFGFGFSSLVSTANQWHALTFPGAILETEVGAGMLKRLPSSWGESTCACNCGIYACVCGCAAASFDA
jgi:hypothetical protein